MIQKSNALDQIYVLIFCRQIGITYPFFVKTYQKEYKRKALQAKR